MTNPSVTPVRRRRLIIFWVLLAVLLFLYLGERPQQIAFIVTAFGDAGELASHEMHMFAQGVFAWVVLAAVAVNLRRPATQVGAAWTYGFGTVLAFSMILSLADLPAEVVPILGAAIVVAALGFLAHPSSLRAKFASVDRTSPTLFALLACATIPLVVYATGQIDIHLGSGPHDDHYTFGHWIVMAVFALLPLVLGAIAALKVEGWRFPLWVTGAMVAALGVGSLGITAVSQLRTGWALAAIGWGAAFVALGEYEAHRGRPARLREPDARDATPIS
jgi:hypothetical protein